MSVTGTYYHGYFFAFHLLNIVNNNQLLSGVIKAVTQNGIENYISFLCVWYFLKRVYANIDIWTKLRSQELKLFV